jgi:Na+/proline symporter
LENTQAFAEINIHLGVALLSGLCVVGRFIGIQIRIFVILCLGLYARRRRRGHEELGESIGVRGLKRFALAASLIAEGFVGFLAGAAGLEIERDGFLGLAVFEAGDAPL